MEPISEIAGYWLWADEFIGAALGVAIVLLLIRENVWAWPLGVAYVLVSVTVLMEARLYANLLLHLLGFLPMNLYGWYHWLFGGESRDHLPITRSEPGLLLGLGGLCIAAALGLGWYFDAYTDAALPYWDNGIFITSLAAMWLTARKKIENWIIWLAVNLVSIPVYYTQHLPWYALLYSLYLPMAIWGYITWLRSMSGATSPANTVQ